MPPVFRERPHSARARRGAITHTEISARVYRTCAVPLPTAPVCCTNGSRAHTISCLDVGACLKVNTRALGRGALQKKGDSIPLLLTSEQHTGRACRRLFTKLVPTIQYPNHIYTKPLLLIDSPASRTEYPKHIVDPMLFPSGNNPFKCHEEVLYLQPLIPPKRFDIFSPRLGDAQKV